MDCFLGKCRTVAALLSLPLGLALGLAVDGAAQTLPKASWERCAPSVVGWSDGRLRQALEFAEHIGSDIVLVVVDGRIIARRGDFERTMNVRSVRKPLLGALLGIEVQRGHLRVEATLEDLGVDENGGLTDRERSATVADLLTSRSGVYLPAAWEHPSHAAARPERGAYKPGTHFYYNNWDFNTLGTIYTQVSGREIFEAFATEVAGPLGMQDYVVESGSYIQVEVSRHPAYVFKMSARDLARFGLLYLRKGRWGDRQVVSRDWVEISTQTQVEDATPYSGYGFLWRTYPKFGTHFAATGAGSQMLVVAPDLDLVLVHLAETGLGGAGGVPRRQFWQFFGMVTAAAPEREEQ
jgi:CubicO group peptidase (beta-lactamase class C family)